MSWGEKQHAELMFYLKQESISVVDIRECFFAAMLENDSDNSLVKKFFGSTIKPSAINEFFNSIKDSSNFNPQVLPTFLDKLKEKSGEKKPNEESKQTVSSNKDFTSESLDAICEQISEKNNANFKKLTPKLKFRYSKVVILKQEDLEPEIPENQKISKQKLKDLTSYPFISEEKQLKVEQCIRNYLNEIIKDAFETYSNNRSTNLLFLAKDLMTNNRKNTSSKEQRIHRAESLSKNLGDDTNENKSLYKDITDCINSININVKEIYSAEHKQGELTKIALQVRDELHDWLLLLNEISRYSNDRHEHYQSTIKSTVEINNLLWKVKINQLYDAINNKEWGYYFSKQAAPESKLPSKLKSRNHILDHVKKMLSNFEAEPDKNIGSLLISLAYLRNTLEKKSSRIIKLVDDLFTDVIDSYFCNTYWHEPFTLTPKEWLSIIAYSPPEHLKPKIADFYTKACQLASCDRDLNSSIISINFAEQSGHFGEILLTEEFAHRSDAIDLVNEQPSIENICKLIYCQNMLFIKTNKKLDKAYSHIRTEISNAILAGKVCESGMVQLSKGNLGIVGDAMTIGTAAPDPIIKGAFLTLGVAMLIIDQQEQKQQAEKVGDFVERIEHIDKVADLFAYQIVMRYAFAISQLSSEHQSSSLMTFLKILSNEIIGQLAHTPAGNNYPAVAAKMIDQLVNTDKKFSGWGFFKTSLSTIEITRASIASDCTAEHIMTSPLIYCFDKAGKLKLYGTVGYQQNKNWLPRAATSDEINKLKFNRNAFTDLTNNNDYQSYITKITQLFNYKKINIYQFDFESSSHEILSKITSPTNSFKLLGEVEDKILQQKAEKQFKEDRKFF